MEATLDLASSSDNLLSPRCQASVFSTHQGPLQCSLARLTWEYCASSWGLASSNTNLNLMQMSESDAEVRVLTPLEDAKLVHQSARRAVPKALHAKVREVQPELALLEKGVEALDSDQLAELGEDAWEAFDVNAFTSLSEHDLEALDADLLEVLGEQVDAMLDQLGDEEPAIEEK